MDDQRFPRLPRRADVPAKSFALPIHRLIGELRHPVVVQPRLAYPHDFGPLREFDQLLTVGSGVSS